MKIKSWHFAGAGLIYELIALIIYLTSLNNGGNAGFVLKSIFASISLIFGAIPFSLLLFKKHSD